METILVTGGAGFIGTHFVEYFARRHPDCQIIDLDALTYAANAEAFAMQEALPNVRTVKGDICDEALLKTLFADCAVTGVIHFAAESHVDNSIADPLRFVRTNIQGTTAVLHAALRSWEQRKCLERSRFHLVSTDEVWGTLGKDGVFTESSPYAPNSPYSASKAAADLMVHAYGKTYGMNVTLSNASNNYGPWQHREKLIPMTIARCLAQEPIPLYGTGLNVRDWLWVGDHCEAIDLIFHHARPGERYCVSGGCELTNLDIVRRICCLLDELHPWTGRAYEELITFVKDRPGHDFRYAGDSGKIERELGWKRRMPLEQGLRQTVQWYLAER